MNSNNYGIIFLKLHILPKCLFIVRSEHLVLMIDCGRRRQNCLFLLVEQEGQLAGIEATAGQQLAQTMIGTVVSLRWRRRRHDVALIGRTSIASSWDAFICNAAALGGV